MEAGMPTVEDARRRLLEELRQAKQVGVRALKIIHGYGSSGKGRRAAGWAAKIVAATEERRVGRAGDFRRNVECL